MSVCYCTSITCTINEKLMQRESSIKLSQFKMGLNDTFDFIRSQILALDPLLDVSKAYSMVLRVEKEKNIRFSISNST